jgi:hypothetical protein
MDKGKHQRPNEPNDTVCRSKCLAATDKSAVTAASGIGARCRMPETIFVTLCQQGAWWLLLGTCEVEEFSMPRRKA